MKGVTTARAGHRQGMMRRFILCAGDIDRCYGNTLSIWCAFHGQDKITICQNVILSEHRSKYIHTLKYDGGRYEDKGCNGSGSQPCIGCDIPKKREASSTTKGSTTFNNEPARWPHRFALEIRRGRAETRQDLPEIIFSHLWKT